jgi:hypothetical protein
MKTRLYLLLSLQLILSTWLWREEMGIGWFFNRDKAKLDILWLRYENLEESANLPDRDVLAQEIVEDLESALEQFCESDADLVREGIKNQEVRKA